MQEDFSPSGSSRLGKKQRFCFSFYDIPPCNSVAPQGHSSRRDSGVTRSIPGPSGHWERQEDPFTVGFWGASLTTLHPPYPGDPHPGPGPSGRSDSSHRRSRCQRRTNTKRKAKCGLCLHKSAWQRVVVWAVPTWPNSPDLFADKRFIFLSQRCNCKTNTVKPLEVLPTRARCGGNVAGVCPELTAGSALKQAAPRAPQNPLP